MAEDSVKPFQYTDANMRCLKCVFVVTDIFNKIMQRLMDASNIPAPAIYARILGDKKFQKKLTSTDNSLLQTLLQDGYTQLHLTLIFKIITYYTNMFINPPTRGWSSNPLPSETEIGDDAQRLRMKRNNFVHKVSNEVSETEFEEFFSEMINICERVDSFLDNHGDESFQQIVKSYKTAPLTNPDEVQRIYNEEKPKAFGEEHIGGTHFIILKSKAFIDEVQTIKESAQNGIPVILIFPEIANSEFVETMNNLRDHINKNLVHVKVERFLSGSLVMEVNVPVAILLNDEEFEKELKYLLNHLSGFNDWKHNMEKLSMVDIVLAGNDAILEDESDYEMIDEENTRYPGSLQVNLQLDYTVQSEKLQTELKHVLSVMVNKSENKIFQSDKPVVSIMELGTAKTLHSDTRTLEVPQQAKTEKSAQVPVQEINVQLLQQFEMGRGKYKGFCCLPDGKLIFTDDSFIRVRSPNGDIQSISMERNDACDVTMTNNNIAAVSHFKSKAISLVDVGKFEVVKVIDMKKFKPAGVTFKDGQLLLCANKTGIMTLNLDSKHMDTLREDNLVDYDSKIATFNDRISYTRYATVVVLDAMYNVIFAIENPDKVGLLCCVTFDSQGHIYVVSTHSQAVVVISHDGLTFCRILGPKDGLKNPSAVQYNSHTRELIVVLNYFKGIVGQYSISS